MASHKSSPLFSLVLRTKNEIQNISSFCEAVDNQTYNNIEFIVVDNFSNDGTAEELCSKHGIRFFSNGPERGQQGNFGMLEAASGEYVGYFDADMYLSPVLIGAAIEYFEQNRSCVALRIQEIILGNSLDASSRRFERQFYENTVVDAARIFRRSALLLTGGFDENAFPTPSAEDWDLDRRISEFGEVHFLPPQYHNKVSLTEDDTIKFCLERGVTHVLGTACFYHNEADYGLYHYLQKKRYYSKSIKNYVNKWGARDKIVVKQLGVKYRFLQVFFENGKFKMIAKHPFLSVYTYFRLFLVGLVFLIVNKILNESDV